MEETTVQGHGPPVCLANERNRASSPHQTTNNRPILSAECQIEEHRHATIIPAHACRPESEG